MRPISTNYNLTRNKSQSQGISSDLDRKCSGGERSTGPKNFRFGMNIFVVCMLHFVFFASALNADVTYTFLDGTIRPNTNGNDPLNLGGTQSLEVSITIDCDATDEESDVDEARFFPSNVEVLLAGSPVALTSPGAASFFDDRFDGQEDNFQYFDTAIQIGSNFGSFGINTRFDTSLFQLSNSLESVLDFGPTTVDFPSGLIGPQYITFFDTGSRVNVTAVPEPGATAFLIFAASALVMRRRKCPSKETASS